MTPSYVSSSAAAPIYINMIRNFLRTFMIGRYGPDHLSVAMMIVSFALYITYAFLRYPVIILVMYLIAGLMFYRILSRNIQRRRAENDRFIRYYWPVKTKVKNFFNNIKQRRTHNFYKCPGCKNTLRVPKGKGKILVTCPKCKEKFQTKT